MDDQTRPNSPLAVFTIGHSNQPLETFLGLLDLHQIEVLVDVRSQPYSKYTPHFSAAELKAAILRHGLKYLFMGKELGGRPEGTEFYDAKGRVNYGLVAQSPFFLEGLERLEKGLEKYRVALMCSEENPQHCHRHLLISRVLAERGIEIVHIRGDGTLQTEAELNRQSEAAETGQLTLFSDEEVSAWKSIRSVSPKKPPPNSSKS
jgi:uncharacterized protein (DUF488 family)